MEKNLNSRPIGRQNPARAACRIKNCALSRWASAFYCIHGTMGLKNISRQEPPAFLIVTLT